MIKLGKPKDEDIYVEEYGKGKWRCYACGKEEKGIESKENCYMEFVLCFSCIRALNLLIPKV